MRDFANSQVDALLMRLCGRAGLAMLFATVLAFLGPFGTYRFSAIERIGYWTIQMAAWLVLSMLASELIWRIAVMRGRSAPAKRIATTVVATLPMFFVVWLANHRLSGWQPTPAEAAELLISIPLIGGAFSYLADRLVDNLARMLDLPTRAAADRELRHLDGGAFDIAPDPTDSALINRLPAHIRNDIICVQVEDHYVRVHSRLGSTMVLMRFSDALRGVDHVPGAQVHRSWWVASEAVVGMRKTGRTAQLTLCNGLAVPVSQPYLTDSLGRWGALDPEMAG